MKALRLNRLLLRSSTLGLTPKSVLTNQGALNEMIFTIIGMAGCGKSCMGRALSSRLKIKLIDSDKLIEKRMEKKLQVLIDELGVDEFRRIEEETLLSIESPENEHLIISTGGSAIYSTKAMDYLKSKGKIIYLYCGFLTIQERLGDYSKRGVVLKDGQTLLDLYNERAPMYESYADFTVNCNGNAYPIYQRVAASAIKRYIKETEPKT